MYNNNNNEDEGDRGLKRDGNERRASNVNSNYN